MKYGKSVYKSMDGILSEDERIVGGFFTDDLVDEYGHMISREAMEKAIEEYKEWMNIRDMHGRPVGKAIRVGGEPWNYIEAQIMDDEVWDLVMKGVYNGFSVGILVTDFRLVDLEDVPEEKFAGVTGAVRKMVEDVGFVVEITDCALIEVSIVDRPANPRARFATLTKYFGSDGEIMELPSVDKVVKSVEVGEAEVEEDVVAEVHVDEKVEMETHADPAYVESVDEKEGESDDVMVFVVQHDMDVLKDVVSECVRAEMSAFAEKMTEKFSLVVDEKLSAISGDEDDGEMEALDAIEVMAAIFSDEKFLDTVADRIAKKLRGGRSRVARRTVEKDTEKQISDGDVRVIAERVAKMIFES